MTEHETIIDVTPVHHSSSRISPEQARASRNANAGSGHRAQGAQGAHGPAAESARRWSPSSALAGLAQMAVGAGLVAIGIPMLILPGPGLLSIGAGVLLAARGLSKVTGR